METKSIAANAENNEVMANGRVKFISKCREFFFMLPVLDENGKPSFHQDPNSNRKFPDMKEYAFTKSPSMRSRDGSVVKGTMKVEPETYSCFFIVDPAVHGADFQRIVDLLSGYCKNPAFKMYTEDDYFKQRNPEAYRIAKEKVAMEANLSDKDKTIAELKRHAAELEDRLGFKKR